MRLALPILALLLVCSGAVAAAAAGPTAPDTNAARSAGAEPYALTDAPDLLATTFTGYPFSCWVLNRTWTIQSDIANIGTAASGPFTVSFYLSRDTTVETYDHLIGQRSCAGVPAGGSTGIADTELVIPSDLPAGTYYFGLFVDTGSQVIESNEVNNRYIDSLRPIALLDAPDLVPYGFSVPSLTVTAGSLTVLSAVQNTGTAAAGPFEIGVYLSQDSTITTADTRIGYREVSSLAPGAATPMEATTVFIHPDYPAGPCYIGTIMDWHGDVSEGNEKNNVRTYTPITITAMPDLIATGSDAPSGAVFSRILTVKTGAKNIGTAAAASFDVGVYLCHGSDVTSSDPLIGWRTINGLAAGAETPLVTTILQIPASVPAGSYHIVLKADSGNTVAESSEIDNEIFFMSSIQLADSPDLTLGLRTAPPPTIVTRTFTSPNVLQNIGTAPAGAFGASFYLSPDYDITTADTWVGLRSVSGLAAGGVTTQESTTISIPASLPGGVYNFGVIIDPGNVVAEGDEMNNITNLGTLTLADTPDLRVSGSVGGPGATIVNRTFSNLVTIQNDGSAPAGGFSIGGYLSTDNVITTADTRIGTLFVSGLAAGAASSGTTLTMTIPASAPAGNYYVGYIADCDNQVTESDETNNMNHPRSLSALVASPDIATWTYVPPQSPIGRSFTIQNVVKNIGAAAAGGFYVGFYLSSDTAITTADTKIGEWYSAGLGAGAVSSLQQTPVTIPASVPAGTYYIGSILDSTNAVTEGNELNNLVSNLAPLVLPGAGVVQVPGGAGLPRDLNADGKYEDVNGNGRPDFADVVLYFNQMSWIAANEPVSLFDYNGNGRIDFADVVWLFNHL